MVALNAVEAVEVLVGWMTTREEAAAFVGERAIVASVVLENS